MSLDDLPIRRGRRKTSYAQARIRARVARMTGGLAQVLAPDTKLGFLGTQMVENSRLLKELSAVEQEFVATETLQVQLAHQRRKLRGLLPRVLDLLDALQWALKVYFADRPAQLAYFGMKVPKPRRRLKPEEQVVATARSNETRKMRHTMSKKAKSRIKAPGAKKK